MKKYHKDYSFKIGKSGKQENNDFLYIGDFYELQFAKEQKNKILTYCLLLTIVQIMLFILLGIINNLGNRNFFIAVPYAFLLFPIAYLFVSTLWFQKISNQMEKVVYDKSFGRSNRCLIAINIIIVYMCIADILLLIATNKSYGVVEIVYLLVLLLFLLVSVLHRKYLQKIRKTVIICRNSN